MRHFEIKSALIVFKSAILNFKKMTSSNMRFNSGACPFCVYDMADNHSDTIWARVGCPSSDPGSG